MLEILFLSLPRFPDYVDEDVVPRIVFLPCFLLDRALSHSSRRSTIETPSPSRCAASAHS